MTKFSVSIWADNAQRYDYVEVYKGDSLLMAIWKAWEYRDETFLTKVEWRHND